MRTEAADVMLLATVCLWALCFTLPIFTGLISTAVGMERLTRHVIVAGLISFAGVVLVAVGSSGRLSTNLKGVGWRCSAPRPRPGRSTR